MRPVHLGGAISTSLRLARGAAPAAALASGLLSPTASGAAGDLDPSFADLGRAYALLNLDGAAWAIEAQEDDWILGGGDYYYSFYYDTSISGFTQRLAPDGSIDSTFAPLSVADMEVLDVAVTTDGSMIGVGRSNQETPAPERIVLTVFRLGPDGAPDAAFGVDGVVHLFQDGTGSVASSVVLEPDGRVVVAGVRDGKLIVLRLLADGTLDAAFADAGVFTGADNGGYVLPKVLRVANGGYRVTGQGADCQVFALTADGAIDASFGASGFASLDPSSRCSDLAALDDGRLLVAGRSGTDQGFAIQLLANGQRDAGFQADAVADAMLDATALEVADGGSILVAGHGTQSVGPGALVMRLQPDGALDASFGNGGSTLIELPSEFGTWPTIHDMAVSSGRVMLAGGDGRWPQQPFVARLLGDADTGGPGVIGIAQPYLDVRPQDGEAVLTVRRMGGRTGPVSVVLRTRLGQFSNAAPGEDYTTVERTLSWGDGDAADQQVPIPLLPDLAGAIAEEHESFEVALSGEQGGAGLGTWSSRISIGPDGDPAGQFAIESGNQITSENGSLAGIRVSRRYYSTGAVSVTVTPVAGTATAGVDFEAAPVTLTWANGEGGEKFANFRIINDRDAEESEKFSVQLSAPTGGAVIGPHSSVEVTILRNDQPNPSPGSGGGAIGLISLMLLGAAEWMRKVSRSSG